LPYSRGKLQKTSARSLSDEGAAQPVIASDEVGRISQHVRKEIRKGLTNEILHSVFGCALSQFLKASMRQKYLIYQLVSFLNASTIFSETSSLLIDKGYPFSYLV
jgi:hypothetical protein